MFCGRHVATHVHIRSTNGLPAALSVPPPSVRAITPCRGARAASWCVGAIPATRTNVPGRVAPARHSRHVPAVRARPHSRPRRGSSPNENRGSATLVRGVARALVPARTRGHPSNRRAEGPRQSRPTAADSPPRATLAWHSRSRSAPPHGRRGLPVGLGNRSPRTTFRRSVPSRSWATSAPRDVAIATTVTNGVTTPQGHALARRCFPAVAAPWVEAASRTSRRPALFDRSLPHVGRPPLPASDPPGGDRPAEPVEGPWAEGPLAEAVAPGPDAEEGPRSWAERPGRHPRRPDRTGGGAAARAAPAVESVLLPHRADRRYFGDLVPPRLGVIPPKLRTAPPAPPRLARDDLPEWRGSGGTQARGRWRGPGGPPRFVPEAGTGGRRVTAGGSEAGGLDEWVACVWSRSSRSATRRSRLSKRVRRAAGASGGTVLPNGSGSGGESIRPQGIRTTWGSSNTRPWNAYIHDSSLSNCGSWASVHT
jgi:hypothetical protein